MSKLATQELEEIPDLDEALGMELVQQLMREQQKHKDTDRFLHSWGQYMSNTYIGSSKSGSWVEPLEEREATKSCAFPYPLDAYDRVNLLRDRLPQLQRNVLNGLYKDKRTVAWMIDRYFIDQRELWRYSGGKDGYDNWLDAVYKKAHDKLDYEVAEIRDKVWTTAGTLIRELVY